MGSARYVSDGPGAARSVVCFADHDDPDLIPLAERLRGAGVEVAFIELGLPEGKTDLFASETQFVITQGATTVTSEDLRRALVLFRRWRVSPPRPPVLVPALDGPEREFAEREWEAAVEGVLAGSVLSADARSWANSPESRWRAANKLFLLAKARTAGFKIPSQYVGTRIPPDVLPPGAQLVAKGLGVNEALDDRYVPTTLITEKLRGDLTSKRAPCPSYLQRHVAIETELRILYLFGAVSAVEHRVEADYDDLRYVPPEDVVRQPLSKVDSTLVAGFRSLSAATGLELFTADVLVEASGAHWLVDVTPDGIWAASDPSGDALFEASMRAIERSEPTYA